MKEILRILRNILFLIFLLLLILLFLILLHFLLKGSLYAAPAPIPKNVSKENKLIGTWHVTDCGCREIWIFYGDGRWRSESSYYGGSDIDGIWNIRHRNYLYISYKNTQCIHKLGTKVHTRYDTRDGSVWPNLKLIFIKKVK